MSGLRTLHYASRDPYAGSVNLLGKTPYLSSKSIKAIGPKSPELEIIIMALYVEKELFDLSGDSQGHVVLDTWRQIVHQSIVLGEKLFQNGQLRQMRDAGISVREVIDALAHQVK